MNAKIIYAATAALVMGLAAGYFLFSGAAPISQPIKQSGEKDVDYWVAPMDPNYRRDAPGKSPMGMDLIPVYVGQEAGANDVGFKIPANVLANLGVKVEAARIEEFAPKLPVTGKAYYNEEQTSLIHIRAVGWVEKLFVRSQGATVKKGDILFTFYSPEIATALSDYLQLKNTSQHLRDIAHSRLEAYGLADQSIQSAVSNGNSHQPIPVFASRSGVVTKLGIFEGGRIAGDTVAYALTSPDTMWMIADVYPKHLSLIDQGQAVTLSSGNVTSIDYIYPDADEKLQTLKVRMVLPNEDRSLKAGQYLAATITTKSKDVLTIPTLAIIRLGDMDRVIVAHGEGQFEAAEVRIGASSDGRTVIVSGLSEGEEVVVSGQFMLDSESSFSGASVRLTDKSLPVTDMQKAVVESLAFATAIINSIDQEEGSLNITHSEIPEIGWPVMTMGMQAVNGIDISNLIEGQKIKFGIGKNSDGMYVITDLEPVDAATQNQDSP